MHKAREHHSHGECGVALPYFMRVWGTYLLPVGDTLDLSTSIHYHYATIPAKQARIYHSYILCNALQCTKYVGTTVVGNVGWPCHTLWECGAPVSPL